MRRDCSNPVSKVYLQQGDAAQGAANLQALKNFGVLTPDLVSFSRSQSQLSQPAGQKNGRSEEGMEPTTSQNAEKSHKNGSSDVETSSSGSSKTSVAINIDELTACCLAEPGDNGKYICCPRRASGIHLSNQLREICVMKRFPFVYNSSRRHYYLCLYHRRIIKHEPKLGRNESLKKRNLSKYEADLTMTPGEKLEMLDDPLLRPDEAMPKFRRSNAYLRELEMKAKLTKQKRKKAGEESEQSESDDSGDDGEDRPRRSARHANATPVSSVDVLVGKVVRKEKLKKPMKEGKLSKSDEKSGQEEEPEGSTPSEVPMKILPANTLRRYKKAFQLPHRSGTNTKMQLLEGVSEHLASLNVPAHETIAQFLFTVKTRKNKLDFPLSNDNAESLIGHYIP